MVKSVQHFDHYLYGRQFTVHTDHTALRWLLEFRNWEGQVACWIECLQHYDFQIENKASVKHGNADAIFKCPCLPDGCKHCSNLEQSNCDAFPKNGWWLSNIVYTYSSHPGRPCHFGAVSTYSRFSWKITPLAQWQSGWRRAESDHLGHS